MVSVLSAGVSAEWNEHSNAVAPVQVGETILENSVLGIKLNKHISYKPVIWLLST